MAEQRCLYACGVAVIQTDVGHQPVDESHVSDIYAKIAQPASIEAADAWRAIGLGVRLTERVLIISTPPGRTPPLTHLGSAYLNTLAIYQNLPGSTSDLRRVDTRRAMGSSSQASVRRTARLGQRTCTWVCIAVPSGGRQNVSKLERRGHEFLVSPSLKYLGNPALKLAPDRKLAGKVIRSPEGVCLRRLTKSPLLCAGRHRLAPEDSEATHQHGPPGSFATSIPHCPTHINNRQNSTNTTIQG